MLSLRICAYIMLTANCQCTFGVYIILVLHMPRTCLKQDISDNFIRLSGYSFSRYDRFNYIKFYIHYSIQNYFIYNSTLLEDSTGNNYQLPYFLYAEIVVNNISKLLLAVVYIPLLPQLWFYY